MTEGAHSASKNSPETPLTYEDVLRVLGIEEVPGDQRNKDFAVEVMEDIRKEQGENWREYVREPHRRAILLKEMEFMPDLM